VKKKKKNQGAKNNIILDESFDFENLDDKKEA